MEIVGQYGGQQFVSCSELSLESAYNAHTHNSEKSPFHSIRFVEHLHPARPSVPGAGDIWMIRQGLYPQVAHYWGWKTGHANLKQGDGPQAEGEVHDEDHGPNGLKLSLVGEQWKAAGSRLCSSSFWMINGNSPDCPGKEHFPKKLRAHFKMKKQDIAYKEL